MKPKASAGRWVWMALLAWFCANLLSQSLYMGRYGLPYDAQTMLKQLGPLYVPLLVLEGLLWVAGAGWLLHRGVGRLNRGKTSAGPSEATMA